MKAKDIHFHFVGKDDFVLIRTRFRYASCNIYKSLSFDMHIFNTDHQDPNKYHRIHL